MKRPLNFLKHIGQEVLKNLFPYRGYIFDHTPNADTHERIGGGYVKGARESHFLTAGQIERAFSKNY